MLDLYPGFIDNTCFKYINIDEKYIGTICLISYPPKMVFLEFMSKIPKNLKFSMSIFVNKKNTMKVLKELTYNISNTKAEMKIIKDSQIDIDVLDKTNCDSKKLRYEIQINNEQIYQINAYVSIQNLNKDELIYSLNKLRSILYSKMYLSNLLNFRHMQGYLSTLPLKLLDDSISKSSCVYMTTSNVVNLFPFYSETVFDKNGIIFGYIGCDKKICNINIFNSRYINSNICVFGSSGSGKSYFIKLLILRNYMIDIKQIIFDPEGEYVDLVSNVGGEYVSFNNSSSKFINIMDIYEKDISNENFLNEKVKTVYDFLSEILKIDEEYKEFFVVSIRMSYLNKGINENISSMYNEYNMEKIYVNKKIKSGAQMPILEDICINMKNNIYKQNKGLKKIILEFEQLLLDYKFLNNITNIDIDNNLVVLNFNKTDVKIFRVLFRFILNNIVETLKLTKSKSLIYIDELWKFIYNDTFNAEQIFMLFKTIRKLNSGIVVITQDVSDFFVKDLGSYGKSIVNNSFIKIFFKMEYCDIEIINKIGIFTTNELDKISRLNKGNMLMSFQSNIIELEVRANKYENKLIKGEELDSFSC